MSGSQQFGNGGSEASDDAVFLGSDDATCLGHRGDDGLGIEGLDGERIYDFRGNALSLELDGGLHGLLDLDATSNDRHIRTLAQHVRAPELELEVFAHGSMCVAYSGRCLLSASLMGAGRSASKGACTQPCRWGWSLVEEQSGAAVALEEDGRGSYLLSSNDLCMIEHLDELRDAGVDALKIEGRAKGSYYAACVTNAYRHVLDGAPVEPWRAELDAVSHRPYATGFFFGEAGQVPARSEYVRDRLMVGVVKGCVPVQEGFLVEIECRNRAGRADVLQVLAPREDVRTTCLVGLEELQDGVWTGVDAMVHNMGRYRFVSPWPLGAGDLLCAATA